MMKFIYLIEATSETIGNYVKHILQMHGMLYPWEIKKSPSDANNTIRIAVNEISQASFVNQKSSQSTQGLLISELFLSTDSSFLKNLGFTLKKLRNNQKKEWGYIISEKLDNAIPEHILPIPLHHSQRIEKLGDGWFARCYLSEETSPLSVFSASRIINGINQNVICIDIIKFLNYSMLGPENKSNIKYEEWTDVYGSLPSQSLANVAYIDKLINLIINLLIEMSWKAFPVKVGYYPPEKSAPIIITGDTDDATNNQIDDYLTALEKENISVTLLMKKFNSYSEKHLNDILLRNHAFGIHPYSESGTVDGYINNFNSLCDYHNKTFDVPISGVRNHRFQWVDRTIAIELEKDAGVFFDLNCIAVTGHSWLGTGSGTGFPISFPPQNNLFNIYPLQLPTIIEDDVFLFDYDYCYIPFKSGDRLSVFVLIEYLQTWIFNHKLPAVLNLHPEHVTPNKRIILDEIIQWISSSNLWTPSLFEFANWIEDRSHTNIEVSLENNNLEIYINTPVSIIVQISEQGNLEEKNNGQFVINEQYNMINLKCNDDY